MTNSEFVLLIIVILLWAFYTIVGIVRFLKWAKGKESEDTTTSAIGIIIFLSQIIILVIYTFVEVLFLIGRWLDSLPSFVP